MIAVRKLHFAFGLSMALWCCLSWAALPVLEEVHFAGVSFISNSDDIEKRFPLVSKAIGFSTEKSIGTQLEFDQRLRMLVMAQTPEAIQFANKDSASQSPGDYLRGTGKALSFAFSHESVEVQEVDGRFLVVYDISAQILFFDYSPEAKHVIASYPVRVRYTDSASVRPAFEHKLSVVKRLLFNFQDDKGLVKHWISRMVKSAPKGGDSLVNVASVTFTEKAKSQLPTSVSEDAYAVEVAQFLESSISDEWRVPIVPVTPGQANQKMSLVFSNSDAAECEMPQPSWTVHLQLRDFRKIAAPLPEDRGERIAYGVFATFAVKSDILPGKPTVGQELKVRHVESLNLLKATLIRLNDWDQFRTVVSVLLTKLVKDVPTSEKDRLWILENSSTPNPNETLNVIKAKVVKRSI